MVEPLRGAVYLSREERQRAAKLMREGNEARRHALIHEYGHHQLPSEEAAKLADDEQLAKRIDW